jgi:hypothetical protein
MAYEYIDYTVTAGRAEVVLDRPDVHSGLSMSITDIPM